MEQGCIFVREDNIFVAFIFVTCDEISVEK